MNKKIVSFTAAMICMISVVIIICVKGSGMMKANLVAPEDNTVPIIMRVGGFDMEYAPKDRKLTIEDFEDVELRISESDLKEQMGEPDGYLTGELGEINVAGVGNMVYVLEDGRAVVPFFGFWNSKLFSLVVYEGDHMVCTIKELYEVGPDEVCVEGVIKHCPPENRKLTVEDFDDIELWDTATDVVEKVGEPNTWTGSGLPGDPVFVLKDGRGVIPYFMNGYLYKLIVWKGDSIDCILRAIDESDIREVRCNGEDIQYVTRHRDLCVEDFEDIELGASGTDIKEKIGEPDSWVRDSEKGMKNPIYILEDGRVAMCYMPITEGTRYLEKIIIYNGDDIDLVLKELDE